MTTACRDVVGQVVSYEERFYGEAKSRRMPENGAVVGSWGSGALTLRSVGQG